MFTPPAGSSSEWTWWKSSKGRDTPRLGSSMSPKITLTDTPDYGVLRKISELITEFNEAGAGRPNDHRPLVIVLSHPDTGETLGGLWGATSFSFLHIDLLYIPDGLRGAGLGSRLVRQAEEEAIQRGCHGAWLDTFSFQARGFYECLGYVVCGRIEDNPPGHQRFFMNKALKAAT